MFAAKRTRFALQRTLFALFGTMNAAIVTLFAYMHIGKQIKAVMMQKGLSSKALARKLGTKQRAVQYLFKRSTTTIDKLLQVSEVLQHNFFAYYVQNDARFNTASMQTTIAELQKQNTALHKEIEILQRELNLLKEVMIRR